MYYTTPQLFSQNLYIYYNFSSIVPSHNILLTPLGIQNTNYKKQTEYLNTSNFFPITETVASTMTQTIGSRKNASSQTARLVRRRNYRNKSKLIQSAKKNCESNIVNHILGFLSKNRESERILDQAILRLKKSTEQAAVIKNLFYDCLRIFNIKRERKYINRKTILCLFKGDRLGSELLALQDWIIQKGGGVSLDQLCYLYRITVYYYMRTQSLPAILTSKRIESVAKKIHLKRRTIILETFESQS